MNLSREELCRALVLARRKLELAGTQASRGVCILRRAAEVHRLENAIIKLDEKIRTDRVDWITAVLAVCLKDTAAPLESVKSKLYEAVAELNDSCALKNVRRLRSMKSAAKRAGREAEAIAFQMRLDFIRRRSVRPGVMGR